jgi:hypothetical protein
MKPFIFTIGLLACAQWTFAQTNNVGIGTATPTSKLSVNGSFSANYNIVSDTDFTLSANDYAISWSNTTGGVCRLPAAVSGVGNYKGRIYLIKNSSADQYLTIVSAAGENVDGQASLVGNPGSQVMLINTGATSGTTWAIFGTSFPEQDAYRPIFNGRLTSDFHPDNSDDPIPITGIFQISDDNNVWDDASSIYTCKRSGVYEILLTVSHESSGNPSNRIVFGLISTSGGDINANGDAATPGQWLLRGNFQENNDGRTETFINTVRMTVGKQYQFGMARPSFADVKLKAISSGNTGSGFGTYFSIKRLTD